MTSGPPARPDVLFVLPAGQLADVLFVFVNNLFMRGISGNSCKLSCYERRNERSQHLEQGLNPNQIPSLGIRARIKMFRTLGIGQPGFVIAGELRLPVCEIAVVLDPANEYPFK